MSLQKTVGHPPVSEGGLDVTKLPEEAKPDGTYRSEPENTHESWTVYSRVDLHTSDAGRRAWLRAWAEMRDYPRSWFTMHGKYSGYYKTGILPGKEGWARFLEHGGYYEVYCLFVAVFTPQIPLEHYLQDAAQRGEIELDGVRAWTPESRE